MIEAHSQLLMQIQATHERSRPPRALDHFEFGREDAMRSLLFGSIIVVLLADLTPAMARKARHYSGPQPSYSACVCHWGYAADNSGDACEPAVSCNTEGGQCVRSCPPVKVGE